MPDPQDEAYRRKASQLLGDLGYEGAIERIRERMRGPDDETAKRLLRELDRLNSQPKGIMGGLLRGLREGPGVQLPLAVAEAATSFATGISETLDMAPISLGGVPKVPTTEPSRLTQLLRGVAEDVRGTARPEAGPGQALRVGGRVVA